MTGAKSSTLVPALGVPSRSSGETGTRQRRRGPLPLPRMAQSRLCRTVFGVAVMDNRGRVHDVVVQRALAWGASRRLDIREQAGVIVVKADENGMFRISNDGFLRLPLTVRHWCGLVPGDRVLLATSAGNSVLTLYPPASLDALLFPASAPASAGDAA